MGGVEVFILWVSLFVGGAVTFLQSSPSHPQDSYERYLDIQSQKYNIDYSAKTSMTDPTSLGPGNEHLHCFFPDDDPHLKKTLKF